MEKLSMNGKVLLGVAALIVVGVLIWAFSMSAPQPAPSTTGTQTGATNGAPSTGGNPPSATQTGTGGSQPSSGGTSKTTTGGGTGATSGTTSNGRISIVSPSAGQTWTATTQSTIQWSKEAGVTGYISLLDATTYKLVGVILNQTGPHQTSYTWNTRDLLLSRSSPTKITVTPGRYVVRIAFDGNNLSPITSVPVTIAPAPPGIQ